MTTETKGGAQANTDAGAGTDKGGDKGGDKGASQTGDKGAQQTDPKAGSSIVGDAATQTGDAADKGGKGAADGAADDKGGKEGAGDGKPKPPDKYELTLPDGAGLDDSDVKYVEELARKAGWTNDEAQDAINEHVAVIRQQADRYRATTKADKDYGGERFAESERLTKLVIQKIRPEGHPRRESFLRFMNRGGAGNHIEVVSFLADLGKLMAEDTSTGGKAAGQGGGDRTATEVLYGKKT